MYFYLFLFTPTQGQAFLATSGWETSVNPLNYNELISNFVIVLHLVSQVIFQEIEIDL